MCFSFFSWIKISLLIPAVKITAQQPLKTHNKVVKANNVLLMSSNESSKMWSIYNKKDMRWFTASYGDRIKPEMLTSCVHHS